MTPVSTVLFRLYRPIVGAFAAILVLVELIGVTVITSLIDLRFSFWIAIFGGAAKYGTMVAGIMLITTQMRQLVANGVTRREFAAGVGVFMAVVATAFAATVVLGHWLESALVGAVGERGVAYPVLSAAGVLGEFGLVLPVALGWMLSGALIALGFYRFGPWWGVLLMVPSALPAAVAEAMLGIDDEGVVSDVLPYPAAVLVTLTVIALGAVAFRLLTRDVAIRRTAG